MSAQASCGCPVDEGLVRHQRQICTDPVVAQLGWYFDAEHFPGCHPEHERDEREVPKGYQPAETEDCWHCGTPTPHGCNCAECWEQSDYVPASAVYHCPTCRRWWAWMTGLNVTHITFGSEATS